MRAAIFSSLLLVTAVVHARPRVTLTYFGVAGFSISDGKHTILIDPYFSRPSDTEHPVPDAQAIAAHAPARADVILVGHAHYDHALDVPAIARATGALVVGSREVAVAARAAGVADDKILLAKGGEDYELDGFSVRVVPSLHSFTGWKNGDDVQTFAYLIRLGGVTILAFDTANFVEREVDGLRPDVAIVAPGWGKVHDYSCRLMRALGRPPVVVATHFDDHKKPAATPLTDEQLADLGTFEREIHACAKSTRVIVPRPFVPFTP